ncbi:MAG: hypothetical protein ABL888_10615 [Pirellulaceae bacterium]
MNPLIYEWWVIGKFADQVGIRICNRVVRYVRSITSTTSGEDSPLRNAWEEICAQVQSEEWLNWEVFESVVDQAIEEEVNELPEHELAAIWFQTEEGQDWGFADAENRKEPNIDRQVVVALIRNRVFSKASDHTNVRIQKWLDRYS